MRYGFFMSGGVGRREVNIIREETLPSVDLGQKLLCLCTLGIINLC